MKKLTLGVFILIASVLHIAIAQELKPSALSVYVMEKRKTISHTETVSLFTKKANNASLKTTVKKWQTLSYHRHKKYYRSALFITQPKSISVNIPYIDTSFTLELIRENISIGALNAGKLTGKGNREKAAPVKAVHYRGYIKNNTASIACLSVFGNGDIMCLFSDASGNYNLGKTSDGSYVLFKEADMLQKPAFECGTNEIPDDENAVYKNNTTVNSTLGASTICNKVRIYWEANYHLYNGRFNSNYTNTINYLSGLFNQVSTMYMNEGIVTELSEVNIWTTPDTFTVTSSGTGLTAIRNRWNATGNNFNGDLCMLIDGSTNNNGGRAYLLSGGMCSRTFAYGYSNVYASYSNLPAYSWDVEVLTHETGHNMGSNHTQWCGWNTGDGGTCGAIDNCVALETSSTCPSCSATTTTNPAPIGFQGTVMSYCHLRSGIGINLYLGFGPLPSAKIRAVAGISSCLTKGSTWTGVFDNSWENPGNWSCGTVPNSQTDVTIPEGLINYPVVNSAAECRKLYQEPGSSVSVNTEFSLEVLGRE